MVGLCLSQFSGFSGFPEDCIFLKILQVIVLAIYQWIYIHTHFFCNFTGVCPSIVQAYRYYAISLAGLHYNREFYFIVNESYFIGFVNRNYFSIFQILLFCKFWGNRSVIIPGNP